MALAGAILLAACSSDPTTRAHEAPATVASTAQPTSSRSPSRPPGEVTLAFGGDVHFEGVIRGRLAANPAGAMGPIGGVLRRADIAMVNLESAITTRGTPAGKSYVFRAPPTAFTALRSAGVDVVTQANNHGMDFGLVGLRESVAAARAARFPVVGIGLDDDQAYAPYRVTVHGQRLAFLGATQVLDSSLIEAWSAGPGKPGLASAKRVDRLVAAVRAARAAADTVVVYLHWGTERVSCPTPVQRELARTLVAAGADVVVGSHAHVLLGAGYLNRAYVGYGLGNFVFYSSGGGPNTESGVLMLTVRGRSVERASWAPARISGGVPIPLAGAAASAARQRWERLQACTGLSAHPS